MKPPGRTSSHKVADGDVVRRTPMLYRITRWIPPRWRGAVLLAVTILLFPVIITAIILEAVTPRASADMTFAGDDSNSNSNSNSEAAPRS